MIVSVILCTHNGSNRIETCLESLLELNLSGDIEEIEVNIIDNASIDDTKEKILRFVQGRSAPSISCRYMYEKNAGLSNARNRGVEESKGEVIAFVDDDAVVDPDWISELVRAHGELNADVVGGRTFSRPQGVPDGTDPRVIDRVGVFDMGPEPKVLKGRRCSVHGCNFSCKSNVFKLLGGFDSRLGRTGEQKLAMEEYHLCLRVTREGMVIGYNPGAVAYHIQEKSRFTRQAVLNQAYWHGYSRCFAEYDVLGNGWVFLSSAKKIAFNFIRNGIPLLFSSRLKRIYWLLNMKGDIGFLTAACQVFSKRT